MVFVVQNTCIHVLVQELVLRKRLERVFEELHRLVPEQSLRQIENGFILECAMTPS